MTLRKLAALLAVPIALLALLIGAHKVSAQESSITISGSQPTDIRYQDTFSVSVTIGNRGDNPITVTGVISTWYANLQEITGVTATVTQQSKFTSVATITPSQMISPGQAITMVLHLKSQVTGPGWYEVAIKSEDHIATEFIEWTAATQFDLKMSAALAQKTTPIGGMNQISVTLVNDSHNITNTVAALSLGGNFTVIDWSPRITETNPDLMVSRLTAAEAQHQNQIRRLKLKEFSERYEHMQQRAALFGKVIASALTGIPDITFTADDPLISWTGSGHVTVTLKVKATEGGIDSIGGNYTGNYFAQAGWENLIFLDNSGDNQFFWKKGQDFQFFWQVLLPVIKTIAN